MKTLCACIASVLLSAATLMAQINATLINTVTGELSGGYNRGGEISPDGQKFAVGGANGILKIFNSSNGSVYKTLYGHSSYVNGVAFSPDGKKLASISSDKTLKIWDVAGGYAIKTFSDFNDLGIAVAFSPDGKYVAAGSYDNQLKVYDINGGYLYKTLYGHNNTIWSVQFSPDGKYLLSGDTDGNIKVWSTSSWYMEKSGFQAGWITSIRFTSDGTKVVTTSESKTVRIWSFPAMYELKTMSHTGPVWMCDVSPDNKYVASGGKDNVVRIWDIITGAEVKTLYGHSANACVVLFTADGSKLISASDDNSVKIWSLSGLSGSSSSYSSSYTGGSEIVVAKDGSGQYSSIQSAVTAASSGAVIRIKPGTYYENVSISKPLTLKGDGAKQTFINGSSETTISVSYAQNVKISGLAITNNCSKDPSAGILLTNSSAEITDNLIYKCGDEGINAKNSTVTVTHNTIVGNGRLTQNGVGVYVDDKSYANIKSNIISDNSWGVYVFSGSAYMSYNCVYNNSKGDYTSITSKMYEVTSNPGFTNAYNNDYTLGAYSSCKNKGENGTDIGVINWYAAGSSSSYSSSYTGGSEIVVAKDGSGQYSTIASALYAATSGSTIKVKAGTYYESGLSITRSNIKLMGEGPGKTIIDAGGKSYVLTMKNVDNITVSGFTFKNSSGTGGALTINACNNVTYSNNVFTELNDYGLYIWSSNPVITNNIFYKVAGGEYASAKDAIAMNGSSPVIKNNIFYNNAGGSAIDVEGGTSNPVINYNIIYSSGQAFKNCYGGTGNLFSDPMLNTWDFTLRAGSPAIGKGENGNNIGLATTAVSTYSGYSGTQTGGSFSATLSKTLTYQISGDYTRCGAMDPNGQFFAIGAGEGAIKLFKTDDGSFYKSLTGHTSWMNGMSISKDGSKIATASSDKTARVWSVSGGYALNTFYDFKDHVLCTGFSPDGKYLAVSGYDKYIKIYDLTSGYTYKTLYDHTSNVWSVQFSPDGKYLLSGDDAGNIKLFSTTTWTVQKTLYHSGTITHFAFTSDGSKVVSTSSGSTAKIWSFPAMSELKTLNHSDKIWMAAVTPDDKYVITGSWDKTIKVWDINTGSAVQTLSGHTNNIGVVLISPDGKTIVSAGDDNMIKLWTVSGVGSSSSGSSYSSTYTTTSSDGLSATLDKTISYQLSGEYNRGGAMSKDGSKFAIGGKDGSLKIFNTSDGSLYKSLSGHSSWVNSLAFSPDGTKLASGCSDKTLKIWDVSGGYAIKTFSEFTSDVISVAYSADGKYVAAGGFDNTVRVYDVSGGYMVKALYGHANSIWSVQFSPDGKYLISGDSDGNIKVWNTSSWYQEKTGFQTGWITSIRFTSDGSKMVTTSYGNTVRVWNFPGMYELKTMSHTGNVWMAAISPDNKYVISSGNDKVIRIWDIQTGSNIKTLYGHSSNVGVVLMTSDGKKLVSASDDNTIKLWSVSGVGTSSGTSTYTSYTGYTGTARTLTVAKDNSGQYTSISSALAAAQSGDIIQVKAGTYFESGLSITKPNIKLLGDGPEKTIVDASGKATVLSVKNANGVTVSGFTFKNSSGTGGALTISASNATFSNNVLRELNDYGLYIWDCNPTIANNVFYKVAGGEYADAKDAIGLNSANAIIKNNVFYNNFGGSAIDNENSSYPVISYNIIHSSGQAFKKCYGGTGNLFLDPMLNTWDFTLQAGSPGIGKGEGGSNIGILAAGGVQKSTVVVSGSSVSATLFKTLYGHNNEVRGIDFSPNNKYIASGDSKGNLFLWDAVTGAKVRTFYGHTSYINSIHFSPDGNKMATVSSDKKILVWDVNTGTQLFSLTGHTDLIVPVRFSPDGQYLATGSFDNTVKIWNAQTGALVRTLTDHKSSLWSIAFSKNGILMASGDTEDEIILWNTSSWTKVRSMKSGSSGNWVNGLEFSDDGKLLYSGNYNNNVIIWDVATGVSTKTLFGHTNHIWGLALSPDGKVIATASADRTVKLWDAASGQLITTLADAKDALFNVAFSRDGSKLTACSDDKNVYVWSLKGVAGAQTQTVSYETTTSLPPFLTATAVFSDADGNNVLSAGESGKITMTIKNTGKGPALGVNAKFSITAGSLGMFLGNPSYYVGDISPGSEKTVSTTIDASEDVIDQKVSIRAEATEKNGFGADAITVNFNTKELDPPLLTLSKFVIRDDGSGQSLGNGDGNIQKKETIEITVFVSNSGRGTASNVKLSFKSGDSGVLVSQGTATVGDIPPGEVKKGVFVFAVSDNYNSPSSKLPLSVEITEKRPRFSKTEELDISLDKSYRNEVVVDVVSNVTHETKKTVTGGNIKDKVDEAIKKMNAVIDKTVDKLEGIELPMRENVYALIVGISDYENKDVPSLSYAINDAAGVYAMLTNKIVGGIPAENVKFLKGAEATGNNIKMALNTLVNYGIDDEKATLIFYYSGHGAPEQDEQGNVKTAYLIPYDGNPKFISITGIGVDYLQQELSKVKAKNVFVALDACFTGSGRSFMKKGARGINLVPKEIIKQTGTEGRVFMTAAANDQSAFDYPDNQHGLFTNYLLEALTGKGDSDPETGNNDGWVTSSEVFNYLKDRVSKTARRQENVKQEPQMIGTGEIKLTRTMQKTSGTMSMDEKLAKVKKAFNDGAINMNQYTKAYGQIKSGTENQTLKDFISGKIDVKKFADNF